MLRRTIDFFKKSLIQKHTLKHTLNTYQCLIEEINALEAQYQQLNDNLLFLKTGDFRLRISDGEEIDRLLPEVFATLREACRRTIGIVPNQVQVMGGLVLHQGSIAEIQQGEGKEISALFATYLNALTSHETHFLVSSDYHATKTIERFALILVPLGLRLGLIQSGDPKKGFLIVSEGSIEAPACTLVPVDRRAAYQTDVIFGRWSEFAFDYLRDNMLDQRDKRVQTELSYALIDDIDSALIDEARTPLNLVSTAWSTTEWYLKIDGIVRLLTPDDVVIDAQENAVILNQRGRPKAQELLGSSLSLSDQVELVSPERAQLLGYFEQSLRAHFLFQRNRDYVVSTGKVIALDRASQQQLPHYRYGDGLHQALEAKEGVPVQPKEIVFAQISLQNYIRMYPRLAGMTSTALTEAEEFHKIYNLEVVPIPTDLEYQTLGENPRFVEIKTRDEDGYPHSFYAKRGSPSGKQDAAKSLFYRRKDYPDVIYKTVEAKVRAVTLEILREHLLGRPVLVGTTSVQSSNFLSNRLKAESIRRLLQIALVRRIWMNANHREVDGRLIPELAPFNGALEEISAEKLLWLIRPFGSTNINPEAPENFPRVLGLLGLEGRGENLLKRLVQDGVPHQVLNAGEYEQASRIMATAGTLGAVTIATNMAGRGVDIKLGGELPDEILVKVNRVLRKAGYENPSGLSLQDRCDVLKQMEPSQISTQRTEVRIFLQHCANLERVKALGGLHVIGLERHEARRLDNQLSGLSAHQGNPGSSRFYLSLEDDLMRIQGGLQVSTLMDRLQVDDSLPLEARLLGGLIEQAQRRIEGANFDARKRLLEYDNVLDTYRKAIYQEHRKILEREDLQEDMVKLVTDEIRSQVTQNFMPHADGTELLSWLERIQPSFGSPRGNIPSFPLWLVIGHLLRQQPVSIYSIRDVIIQAVESQHAYLSDAIQNRISQLQSSSLPDSAELNRFLTALESLTGSNFREKVSKSTPTNSALAWLQVAQSEMSIWRSSLIAENGKIILNTLVNAQAQTYYLQDSSYLTHLLLTTSREDRTGWNPSNHRMVKNTYTRFHYTYLALRLIQDHTREELEAQIVNHLCKGLEALQAVWGESEFTRLSRTITSIGDLGHAAFRIPVHRQNVGPTALTRDERASVVDALGRSAMNDHHRRAMVSSITTRWIAFLERLEQLKTTANLEHHASRDPLSKYKLEAADLFQNLLDQIRFAAISQLYAFPISESSDERSVSTKVPDVSGVESLNAGSANDQVQQSDCRVLIRDGDVCVRNEDWLGAMRLYRKAIYLARIENDTDLETYAQARLDRARHHFSPDKEE